MEEDALLGSKCVQSPVSNLNEAHTQSRGTDTSSFAIRLTNEVEAASLAVEELVCTMNVGCFLVDVRAPGEYAKGHIPGAANIPLFGNDERAKVTSASSKQGRTSASGMARKLVRCKLNSYFSTILKVALSRRGLYNAERQSSALPVKFVFYCWSGGMRSSAVLWLLKRGALPGLLTCGIVRGGYRSFRQFALSLWHPPIDTLTNAYSGHEGIRGKSDGPGMPLWEGSRVCIIGGRTGVGKTRVLSALLRAGEQIIDLERIARHSGSVFGWVGQSSMQPSSEHFTNLVAYKVAGMQAFPKWIFVEDEGPHVGKCSLDPGLFQCMRYAPLVINILASKCLRLRMLVDDYASGERRAQSQWSSTMLHSIGKLQKHLGEEHTNALKCKLDAGHYDAVAEGLLEYYDESYDTHLGEHRPKRKETCADGHKERVGKILQVHAYGIVNKCKGHHENFNPDLLDVDRLIQDILIAVDTFKHKEGNGI